MASVTVTAVAGGGSATPRGQKRSTSNYRGGKIGAAGRKDDTKRAMADIFEKYSKKAMIDLSSVSALGNDHSSSAAGGGTSRTKSNPRVTV